MSPEHRISRRGLIVTAGAIGLPSLTPAHPLTKKRALRIAHLTDIHLQAEGKSHVGFQKCLEAAQNQKPDLILTGGDLIMDSLSTDKESTQRQWDAFMRVLKANLSVPVRHSIGNHDVWGWGDRAKYTSEPKFGKTWACELLEMTKPYYSFDQGGWHVVVLDSTHSVPGNGYTARLDDEQFEWLASDLTATKSTTPVLVVSHIPILGVCSWFDGQNEKSGNWVIPGSYVHIDARRIKDLFLKHSNVKLCISGHEHQLDSVVYNGVHYICNGAVSANWWNGKYFECNYGYGLVDLFDDGTFTNSYMPYTF